MIVITSFTEVAPLGSVNVKARHKPFLLFSVGTRHTGRPGTSLRTSSFAFAFALSFPLELAEPPELLDLAASIAGGL